MQSISSSSSSRLLGSAIIAELQRRGTVSVAFLAKLLGRRPSELEDYLQPLANQGIITRADDNVTLVVAK